ncbi:MAG: hypothetical protein ACXV6K_10225 [Halobacteriota archaeon]
MYVIGAFLIIIGIFVLLSQLGILDLLSALQIPVLVLFALLLIVIGFVLIRGASLVHYSPDHRRQEHATREYDRRGYEGREDVSPEYHEITYEDQNTWESNRGPR